ncbi:lipoprotein [soil metagenome]
MPRVLPIAAVAAALAFAGCGSDDESSSESTTVSSAGTEAVETQPAAEKPAANGTEIKVADSQFGQILFDGDDGAIYLFDKEKSETSECYGECAVAWPPVLIDGDPQAGAGAAQGKLGTTERDDGSTQVTYNGHPLYYYEDDPPGEVLCHNVDEFGGLWLVVDAAGNAVS